MSSELSRNKNWTIAAQATLGDGVDVVGEMTMRRYSEDEACTP